MRPLCIHLRNGRIIDKGVCLPAAVFIGCRRESSRLKAAHHVVELAAPHTLEPIGLAKPPHERGADGVVRLDERPTPKRLGKFEVTVATQRPDLRAVI